MVLHQKLNFLKNTPRVQLKLYLATGLIIAGVIMVVMSANVTHNYSYAYGYSYTFGWREDLQLQYYQSTRGAPIPQIFVTQQLDFSVEFGASTDPGFVVHMFLVPGRNAYLIDANYDYIQNRTYDFLAPRSVYHTTLNYSTMQAYQKKAFSLHVPQDNAYTVTFLADSTAIGNNLTGELFVDNYLVHGMDGGGVLAGLALIGSGMLMGILSVFSPTMVQFIRRPHSTDHKDTHEDFSLATLLQKVETSRKSDFLMSAPPRQRQFISLLHYEGYQFLRSPVVIILIPLMVIMLLTRFGEVYNFWGPWGSYSFSQFGTTRMAQGISLFVLLVSFSILVCLLFMFRDMDEGFHKVRLAFPFRKNDYVLAKCTVLGVVVLLLCIVFVGGTFILIPLRNSAVVLLPITQLWAPFVAYGVLGLALAMIAVSMTLISKHSRGGMLVWGIITIIWFIISQTIQTNIVPYYWEGYEHLQDAFYSHFSLFSIERVIEYLIIRPMATGWQIDYLLYKNDTILSPVLVLGFYLSIILLCLLGTVTLFRRRDL